MKLEPSFSFTKLIVDDLDCMADYYAQVYGMTQVAWVQALITDRPIDEIVLQLGGGGNLILLKWTDEPSSSKGNSILGFTTTNAAALLQRGAAAGGRILQPAAPNEPAGGLLVGFLEDLEGNLAEIVQRGGSI